MSEGDYPDGYGGGWGPAPNYSVSYGDSGAAKAPDSYDPMLIHNTEAEAALLGAMMIANDAIPAVCERLTHEHFFERIHGRIFKAIVTLYEKGRAPSPVLLRPIFEHDPDIKELGGTAYLAQLTSTTVGVIGMIDFADQVAELAAKRVMVQAMRDGIERLCSPLAEDDASVVDDVATNIQDRAAAVVGASTPLRPRGAKAMVENVRQRSIDIRESGAEVGYSCRSVPDLDAVMGKLEPGYHVIAGRPGMAKTSLAMTAAWGWAANGAAGEYYAAEMTQDQIDNRFTSDISHAMRMGIPHERIRSGELTPKEIDDLSAIAEMADTLPINFVATRKCDIRRIETAAQRAKLRWKNKGQTLRFIVVDYLQKFLATDDRGRLIRDETEKVNAISATCEQIAQRLGIAVIALSSVGRAVEDRKNKRPQLNDLRQSGNIEYDADTVLFVYRDEVYHVLEKPKCGPNEKEMLKWQEDMEICRGQLEMISAKNRHQKPRTRTARFEHAFYAIRGSRWSAADRTPLIGPDLFDDGEGRDIL